MRSLLLLSLAKQSNINNWFNGNNSLFGAITAPYNYRNLEEIAIDDARSKGLDQNAINKEQISEMAETALKGIVNYGRAVFPDDIKIEAQKLVDSGIGDSFDAFIKKADEIIEVAVTGFSGIMRNGEVGSYAKAKVQYLVGDAIRWSDMDNIESLANLCIEAILPCLTSTTKVDDMVFGWILDEDVDTTTFLNNLATIATLPLETKDGRKPAITAGCLYKNSDIELPDNHIKEDELLYFDSDSSDFNNENLDANNDFFTNKHEAFGKKPNEE
jgi:hypothetical protein